jgi:hypothetical protein
MSEFKLEWNHWRVRYSAGPRNQRNHKVTGNKQEPLSTTWYNLGLETAPFCFQGFKSTLATLLAASRFCADTA